LESSAPAATFRDAPLITLDRLKAGWQQALAILPEWASFHVFLPDCVAVVVGNKHRIPMLLPPLELAVLAETTRLGHGVVTNANGNGPGARIYAKLSLKDAQDRNPTLRRYLSGADEGSAVKALEIETDYSATNGYFVPDGHAKRAARDEVMVHVKALAQSQLSAHDAETYLANLAELLEALDAGEQVWQDAAE
jgi:hypothetical protein